MTNVLKKSEEGECVKPLKEKERALKLVPNRSVVEKKFNEFLQYMTTDDGEQKIHAIFLAREMMSMKGEPIYGYMAMAIAMVNRQCAPFRSMAENQVQAEKHMYAGLACYTRSSENAQNTYNKVCELILKILREHDDDIFLYNFCE